MKPWTRLTTLILLVPRLALASLPFWLAWGLLAFAEANYPGVGYGLCMLGFIIGAVSMGVGIIGFVGILVVLARARLARENGKGAAHDPR